MTGTSNKSKRIIDIETRNVCSVCSNEMVRKLTCYLLVKTLVICKRFGLNQAQQNVGPDLSSNYLILIVCNLTNSTDPEEMPTYIAFHQGDSLQNMSVLYAAMKGIDD